MISNFLHCGNLSAVFFALNIFLVSHHIKKMRVAELLENISLFGILIEWTLLIYNSLIWFPCFHPCCSAAIRSSSSASELSRVMAVSSFSSLVRYLLSFSFFGFFQVSDFYHFCFLSDLSFFFNASSSFNLSKTS